MEEGCENDIKNITLNTTVPLVPKIEPEDGEMVLCGISVNDFNSVSDALPTSDDLRKPFLSAIFGEDHFELKEVKIVLKDCKQELESIQIKNEPEDYNGVNCQEPFKVEDQNNEWQPNNDSELERTTAVWIPSVISSSPTEKSILGLPESIQENVSKKTRKSAKKRINYGESSPSECGSDSSYNPLESLSEIDFMKSSTRKTRKNKKMKKVTKRKTPGKEKVVSSSSSAPEISVKTLSHPINKSLPTSRDDPKPNPPERSLLLKKNIPSTSISLKDSCVEQGPENNSRRLKENVPSKTSASTPSMSIRQNESDIEQVEVDGVLWSCCGMQFEQFSAFNDHNVYEHSVDKLSCSICIDQSFPSFNAIEKHYMDVHTDSTWKSFHCLDCRLVFGVKSSFLDHKEKCNESHRVCSEILYSIIDFAVTRKQLEKTKIEENSSLRLSCCEKVIVNFKDFIVHKVSEHNIPRLKCGLCFCEKNSDFQLISHYKKFHFSKLWKKLDLIYDPKGTQDKCSKMVDEDGIAENDKLKCTAQHDGVLCQCSMCKAVFNSASSSFSYDNRSNITKFVKAKTPYYCVSCNKYFKCERYLTKHYETHSRMKRFPCDICAQGFTAKLSLTIHKLTVHSSNNTKLPCEFCNHAFSRTSLKKHIQNVHLKANKILTTKIKCKFCGKHFSHKKGLVRHCATFHDKRKEFHCAYCNVVLYDRGYLINHIKSLHLPEEKIVCELCGHSFKTKPGLRSHIKSVHSTHHYYCEVCGKKLKSEQGRLNHMAVHSEEKPFICKTCGKRFKREMNLNQHQYTHSDNRPHICDICGQTFRLRTHVKQHMAVHGLVRKHKCSICEKAFAKKRELNSHLLIHQ